jgi:1,2-diacylglycerol 3-alpha-glucosyltransferase
MRILVFSNAYKPSISGVVTSIALFRQGLTETGHDVYIIVPEYEDYQDEEPYVFRFPALDLPDQLDLSLVIPFKTTMAPTVRGLKPAVIHSQHPVVMGGLAASFARDMNLPLVFTFHTRYDVYAQKYVPIAPDLAGMLTEEIIKRYLEKCTHIVAPTPSIRDFILREYEPDVPVTVVPTPVNLSQYHDLEPWRVRAALGLEQAELLLYVGRLADEKNLDFLLQVFTRVVAERPQARLLLVGRGPHEHRLQRLAQKLGLGERAIFTGPVPHSEVPHYAAAADLFVFPSTAETQGLVLIEAMAAGTPVIAAEALGSADVLTEGGGLLVPAQEDAFTGAVLGLLANEPRRRTLGEQAAQAVQRYAIPTAAARLVTVYEAAIAAGSRPAKKTSGLHREQGPASDAWREVSSQLHALGEGLAAAFRSAWEGEESRRYWPDIRSGMEAMINEINQAIQETSTAPEAQRTRSASEKEAEPVHEADAQAQHQRRPEASYLLSALRQVNAELQKMIGPME